MGHVNLLSEFMNPPLNVCLTIERMSNIPFSIPTSLYRLRLKETIDFSITHVDN